MILRVRESLPVLCLRWCYWRYRVWRAERDPVQASGRMWSATVALCGVALLTATALGMAVANGYFGRLSVLGAFVAIYLNRSDIKECV